MNHPHRNRPLRKRVPFAIGLVLLLALVFWVTHAKPDNPAKAGKGEKKPVSVVITPVTAQTMPLEIKTIGNVESISTVTLKPQIEGQITGIFFKEGDMVQKGQLLFTIDTKPIQASIAQAQATVSRDLAQVSQARAQLAKDQAQVRQAQAALKRDQAQLKYAVAQEQRYAKLLSQQFISQSEYDQALAARRAAEETVMADQAALENSQALLSADQAAIESAEANVRADQAIVEANRIKLAYCYVRAPISGRTGSLKARLGDTVKTNETPLVVINQINPIYVGFSIPEQTMSAIRSAGSGKPYSVAVTTRENPPLVLNGRLNFMENTVDTSTGTIRLKAFFENQNHLWPGQFVDVTLYLAEQPNALVIPSQAIQSGQGGDYVFVADAGKALLRHVTVDRIINDMAVIQAGLKLGEKVVTDGQFQLSPGALIRVKEAALQPGAR
jgi:multidrug efflux system membrane fusion protein